MIGASATAETLEVRRERRLTPPETKPAAPRGRAFAVTCHLVLVK
jgi:hypothetical protein